MKKNKSVSDTEDGSYSIHTNEERTEYFKKLERWLLEAYAWHSFIAAVPFILASSQIAHGSKLSNANANANVNANANANANVNANSNASNQQGNENSSHQRTNEQQMPFQAPGVNGIIYRIPPVWKRYVAEFIDSILMFILKMTVTFLTVDVFNFIDFEKYYLGLQPNLRINYKIALDLASRLLGVEIVSRVFACVFEASWLRFGINGHAGGATPGKLLMRLKVVHCQNVTPASLQDENLVTVVPGTDLGLLLAFGRSVMKHIILAILFPIFYCMCFFRFNRTGYDLCCNSIVVEDVSNENNLHNNNNNNNNNINNNNNNNIHNNNNINVQN